MTLAPLCKKRYVKNKRIILTTLKYINHERRKCSETEIPTMKYVIKKLIILSNFITYLSKPITKPITKHSKHSKPITKNSKHSKHSKPVNLTHKYCDNKPPVKIKKGGFTFILNTKTGKYKRLPKKEFCIDEVKQWGSIRNVQKKTRQHNRKKKETKQEDAINNILTREIKQYPHDLRQLLNVN